MRLARSRVSAMRSLVTGWVRSRSGMLLPAPPERCCMVPKNSGIADRVETGRREDADADAVRLGFRSRA